MPNPILSGRHSIRLKGFDYSRAGIYDITICTQNRLCIFGDIERGLMVLNRLGLLVQENWRNIPKHWQSVDLLEYCVMPNHVHGIIVIKHDGGRKKGTLKCAPKGGEKTEAFGKSTRGSIPTIIKTFKAGVTRQVRMSPMREIYDQIWQRGYYEHIIRSESDLRKKINYIKTNPQNWDKDLENIS
jgi:REP element-mobilizing transposase RayT